MAATPDTSKHGGDGEDQVLTYQPLPVSSAVSANPHIPSVTASAVLGESESVSTTLCRRYVGVLMFYIIITLCCIHGFFVHCLLIYLVL